MEYLEIATTKIYLGTRVNIKWKEEWYDGTVIKLGPKPDLVKISSVEDGCEYLMEPEMVKQNHSRFGDFQVAYNDGESWIGAVLIENFVEGAAKVRWRMDIHSAEKESWFELENIAPIVRNEAYQLQDESIRASKSGLLPTRILDERPRTVENVLYESDEQNEEDGNKYFDSSDNEDQNLNEEHQHAYPENGFHPPTWGSPHGMQQMIAPHFFPPPAPIVSKMKSNLSQASVPCSWSYPKKTPGGVSHHYSSSFFMNLKARKIVRSPYLESTLPRSVRSEDYGRPRKSRLPSVSVKSEHHQPINRNTPKVSPEEKIDNNNKTGRRHTLFQQFLLRKDSRVEVHDMAKLQLGTFNLRKEDTINDAEEDAPKILSSSPDIIMAKSNEHILLTCTAASETPMAYKWHKNDKDLLEASHVQTLGEGILQIKNVTTSDSGTYTCTVSNVNGIVQKSFRVLIQDQAAVQRRRNSPQRAVKSPKEKFNKSPQIPKTEVQSFLDSIVNEMEEFHDSLEDIAFPSGKSKPDVPNITVTNTDSSSTIQSKSTGNSNNVISGEIEDYLEGYGGDDYGALSSTNIEKSSSQVRTSHKRQHHQDCSQEEERSSIDVHTSLGSSDEKNSLRNLPKGKLDLPSDEESVSDQIKRFQLSIQEKEAESLLIKPEPKAHKNWFGAIFHRKKK